MNAPTDNAHHLALRILHCKGSGERFRIGFDIYSTPALQVAADELLTLGYIKTGSSNACAQAFNRFQSEQTYLTPAGRAWLRSMGSDYGSGALIMRTIRAASPALAARVYGPAVTAADAVAYLTR